MKRTIKAIVATATIVGLATQVNAASDTGDATQVVTAALSITNTADLDFGTAPQGDAVKTVAPADPEAGTFDVLGTPLAAYTITLPAAPILMITAGGGTADTEISVGTFVSSPAAGANGSLSAGGTETIAVGATRAAIRATQTLGAYLGTYTVVVVY